MYSRALSGQDSGPARGVSMFTQGAAARDGASGRPHLVRMRTTQAERPAMSPRSGSVS